MVKSIKTYGVLLATLNGCPSAEQVVKRQIKACEAILKDILYLLEI